MILSNLAIVSSAPIDLGTVSVVLNRSTLGNLTPEIRQGITYTTNNCRTDNCQTVMFTFRDSQNAFLGKFGIALYRRQNNTFVNNNVTVLRTQFNSKIKLLLEGLAYRNIQRQMRPQTNATLINGGSIGIP